MASPPEQFSLGPKPVLQVAPGLPAFLFPDSPSGPGDLVML
jgi:hypothetical protein